MTNRSPSLRLAPQSALPSIAHSALVAASLMLLLTWLSAWLFDLGQALVLTTSLAIVVLALAMIGLRLALGRSHDGTRTPLQQEQQRVTPGAHAAQSESQSVDAHAPDPLQGKRWSLDVFATIDAQRFAAVCETWFAWAGFETRNETRRTQEGVDIWLHAARRPGPVAIVRCKHHYDTPVGLQELREFQGVIAVFKDAHGTFTTTSTYTPEALQFARENGIDVVDGRGLLRRILTRTQHSQQALLAVAYHGR